MEINDILKTSKCQRWRTATSKQILNVKKSLEKEDKITSEQTDKINLKTNVDYK